MGVTTTIALPRWLALIVFFWDQITYPFKHPGGFIFMLIRGVVAIAAWGFLFMGFIQFQGSGFTSTGLPWLMVFGMTGVALLSFLGWMKAKRKGLE